MYLHVTRGEEDYKVRILKSAVGAVEQQLEDVKNALERAHLKANEGVAPADNTDDADGGSRSGITVQNPLDEEAADVTEKESETD